MLVSKQFPCNSGDVAGTSALNEYKIITWYISRCKHSETFIIWINDLITNFNLFCAFSWSALVTGLFIKKHKARPGDIC